MSRERSRTLSARLRSDPSERSATGMRTGSPVAARWVTAPADKDSVSAYAAMSIMWA